MSRAHVATVAERGVAAYRGCKAVARPAAHARSTITSLQGACAVRSMAARSPQPQFGRKDRGVSWKEGIADDSSVTPGESGSAASSGAERRRSGSLDGTARRGSLDGCSPKSGERDTTFLRALAARVHALHIALDEAEDALVLCAARPAAPRRVMPVRRRASASGLPPRARPRAHSRIGWRCIAPPNNLVAAAATVRTDAAPCSRARLTLDLNALLTSPAPAAPPAEQDARGRRREGARRARALGAGGGGG